MSSRAAAKRAAQRAEAARVREEQPVSTTDNSPGYRHSFRNQLENTKKCLKEWFEWTPTTSYPTGTSGVDDIFRPQAPQPTEHFALSIVNFYAESRVGRIGRKVVTSSVHNFWKGFCRLFKDNTGSEVEWTVQRRVLTAITSKEWQASHNTTSSRYNRPDVTWADMVIFITYILSSPRIRHEHTRIRLVALTLYLIVTSNRVGSVVLPARDDEYRGLRWSDITVVVKKTAGNVNDIVLEFLTPDGKTRESQNLKVQLLMEPNPSVCPVFWFLVLAHVERAMDWSVPNLLDPVLFENTQSTTRIFKFSSMEHVFQTPDRYGNIVTMTVSMICRYYGRFSKALSYLHPITPHSLRGSVALRLKWLGKNVKDVQAQLRHVFQASAFAAYINNISSVNVTAATNSDSIGFEGLINHLPTAPRPGQAPRLLPSEMEEIYARPELAAACTEHETLRTTLLTQHNVPTVTALPKDEQLAIHRSWTSVRDLLRSHILWELRDKAHVSTHDGDNIHFGPASSQPSHTPVNTNLLSQSTPLQLTEEDVDFSIATMEAFETTVDSSNPANIALLAWDLGEMSDEAYANFLINQEKRDVELTPIAEDELDSLSDDEGSVLDLDAEDVDLDLEEDLPVEGTAAPANSDSVHFVPNANAFGPLVKMLSAETVSSFIQAFTIIEQMPPPQLSRGFRPGHLPTSEGGCPVCGQLLSSDDMFASILHVNKCKAKEAAAQQVPSLIERYRAAAAALTHNPLSGIKVRTEGGPLAITMYTWTGSFLKKGPRACRACPDSEELVSRQQVVEHLSVIHTLNACQSDSFHPRYFVHLQRYECDPAIIAVTCKELLEDRILISVQDNYGADSSMDLSQGLLDVGDLNGYPSDGKYQQITGMFMSTLQAGICILCAHDDTMSWAQRGQEHSYVCGVLNVHFSRCLAKRLSSADPLIVNEDGTLRCTDLTCVANERSFQGPAHFINHLIAVHHMRISGRSGKSRTLRPMLVNLGFANDEEVEAWCDDMLDSIEEKNEKGAKKRASNVKDGKDKSGKGKKETTTAAKASKRKYFQRDKVSKHTTNEANTSASGNPNSKSTTSKANKRMRAPESDGAETEPEPKTLRRSNRAVVSKGANGDGNQKSSSKTSSSKTSTSKAATGKAATSKANKRMREPESDGAETEPEPKTLRRSNRAVTNKGARVSKPTANGSDFDESLSHIDSDTDSASEYYRGTDASEYNDTDIASD